MYMMDGEGEVAGDGLNGTAVALAVLATLILGFLPGTWFDLVRQAALHGVQALAGG
jgi:hypothetical protein